MSNKLQAPGLDELLTHDNLTRLKSRVMLLSKTRQLVVVLRKVDNRISGVPHKHCMRETCTCTSTFYKYSNTYLYTVIQQSGELFSVTASSNPSEDFRLLEDTCTCISYKSSYMYLSTIKVKRCFLF